MDRRWEKLKTLVNRSMVYKLKKFRKKDIGHKDWWDRSCTKRKREVKRKCRMWRKGKIRREEYVKQRIGLRKFLEKKKKRR